MIASASFHRFNAMKHTPRPTISQTPATDLDVAQSQVITGESLETEQPHGREAITKADSKTMANAATPNVTATPCAIRAVGVDKVTGEAPKQGLSEPRARLLCLPEL